MKGTILVIDDSIMLRQILLRNLKAAGVVFDRTLEAGDGLEALVHLRTEQVDLILCDVNMPNMTGIELLQQIKLEKLAVGVPIVMVTTEGAEALVRQAILYGARGYVRKPFNAENIKNSVLPLLPRE